MATYSYQAPPLQIDVADPAVRARLLNLKSAIRQPDSHRHLESVLEGCQARFTGRFGRPVGIDEWARQFFFEDRLATRAEWERSGDERRELLHSMRQGRADGAPVAQEPQHLSRTAARNQYLVPNLLTSGFNVAWGPQEQGKTATLAAAVAQWSMGDPFAGYAPAVPLNVLWVSLEDPAGTANHLLANAGTRGDDIGLAVRITASFPRLIEGDDGVSSTRFFRRDRVVEWCPFVPDLIVVDSWTALLAANGADEVVGAARVIEALRDVMASLGCGVLIIAHSRKNAPDERGNALRDAADVMIPIVREGDGPDGDVGFRWRLADPSAKRRHGRRPATDLVLWFGDSEYGWRFKSSVSNVAPLRTAAKSTKVKAEAKVLAVLTDEPQEAADIVKASGTSASSVSKALKKLVGDGQAAMEQQGGRKTWRIAS